MSQSLHCVCWHSKKPKPLECHTGARQGICGRGLESISAERRGDLRERSQIYTKTRKPRKREVAWASGAAWGVRSIESVITALH